MLMSGNPITSIHCLGDSITEAAGMPECGRWTVLLQQLLNAHAPCRYHVYNHGIGGNTSAMGMERLRNELIGKDITIIEFGLNDCSCQGYNIKNRIGIDEYADNLRAMSAIVQGRGGKPVLVANHLPMYKDEKRQPDGNLYSDKIRLYNERVRSVADAMNLPLIDMQARFVQDSVPTESLFADGLHLSIAGNALYARLVYEGLHII